jgi:hypothetical protein
MFFTTISENLNQNVFFIVLARPYIVTVFHLLGTVFRYV